MQWMKTIKRNFSIWLAILVLALAFFTSLPRPALAEAPVRPLAEVTAYDLIAAMNSLRVSFGLPALIEDPVIDGVAQYTAQVMADQLLSWHIGDVKGRIAAAGYGGGGTVWATENFAVGSEGITIDQIMLMWADEDHMRPANKAYYCNVGAGVATAANGMTYFILQAAYVSGKECGTYTTGGVTNPIGGSTVPSVPGIIVPVQVAEAGPDGNRVHLVKSGQSFWAIAVAYQVTIKEILAWNNLPEGYQLQIGDELTIPGPNSSGYATPTPVGMVIANTPAADGKITHEIQAYQNLSTIAAAYGVTVERLLELNGLSIDTPLQIGQVLLVHPSNNTPTPTPRPLTPIEMLTPAADGKYYHVVKEGQNASWIAGYYGVSLADLMAWNAMNNTTVLYPGDRLLLQVTPPATVTPPPLPPTPTPQPSPTTAPTRTATFIPPTPTSDPATLAGTQTEDKGGSDLWWLLSLPGFALIIFLALRSRKKPEAASSLPADQQDRAQPSPPTDDTAKPGPTDPGKP